MLDEDEPVDIEGDGDGDGADMEDYEWLAHRRAGGGGGVGGPHSHHHRLDRVGPNNPNISPNYSGTTFEIKLNMYRVKLNQGDTSNNSRIKICNTQYIPVGLSEIET